jgi:hypothetical protein
VGIFPNENDESHDGSHDAFVWSLAIVSKELPMYCDFPPLLAKLAIVLLCVLSLYFQRAPYY